jgi:hypothetical protein
MARVRGYAAISLLMAGCEWEFQTLSSPLGTGENCLLHCSLMPVSVDVACTLADLERLHAYLGQWLQDRTPCPGTGDARLDPGLVAAEPMQIDGVP